MAMNKGKNYDQKNYSQNIRRRRNRSCGGIRCGGIFGFTAYRKAGVHYWIWRQRAEMRARFFDQLFGYWTKIILGRGREEPA
jgi:hypothetical protein